MQNMCGKGQVAAGLVQHQKRCLNLEGAMECFYCTYQVMADFNSQTQSALKRHKMRTQMTSAGEGTAHKAPLTGDE